MLVNEGMGSFLCPPNHPNHYFSYENSNISCSIEYIIDNPTEFDKEIVILANDRMNEWNKLDKLSLTDSRTESWINFVMTYFENCYQNPETKSWNATDLLIANLNPIENQDTHAGVHFIRKYYPEFKLN